MDRKKITAGTIVALCFSILWLCPLVLILINSFKSEREILNEFLFLPKTLNLQYYIETWTKFNFPHLIGNTLFYTVFSVIVVIILAPMAAYQLQRSKSRLSKICFGLIILPMMVPFQSYMITVTQIFGKLHLTNTRQGYIIINIGLLLPLATYMIHGFINTIPIELEESACIDGAGKVKTYFLIVYPLLKPILTTVLVLDALASWNDVIVNQLMVGSNQTAINMQNALYMQFSAQTSDWAHALPGTIMSMIPCLIFFVLMQKYIVGGVTAGAIKG